MNAQLAINNASNDFRNPEISFNKDGTFSLLKEFEDTTIDIRVGQIYKFGDGGLYIRCIEQSNFTQDGKGLSQLNFSIYRDEFKGGEGLEKIKQDLEGPEIDIKENVILECLSDNSNLCEDIVGDIGSETLRRVRELVK